MAETPTKHSWEHCAFSIESGFRHSRTLLEYGLSELFGLPNPERRPQGTSAPLPAVGDTCRSRATRGESGAVTKLQTPSQSGSFFRPPPRDRVACTSNRELQATTCNGGAGHIATASVGRDRSWPAEMQPDERRECLVSLNATELQPRLRKEGSQHNRQYCKSRRQPRAKMRVS